MPPNIILFVTDDHGAWATGGDGNREVQTPNLDRLAREGTRFAHAYTPSPVCSPARACLMTGRTPSQVGIHDWLEEADTEMASRDWLKDEVTLFERLKAHGYTTGLSGKWHLGQSHLTPPGVDFYFGLPGWQGDHNDRYTYIKNGESLTLEGNKSGFITDHALEFINGAASPFFLVIGYIATHSPYNARFHRPELTALYQNAIFADIPPYTPHPWVFNEGISSNPTPEKLRDVYTGYYAAVTEIDQNVGRVVAHLDSTSRRASTLVIYASDHGLALGHHGFFGKGNSTRPLNMYETSLRVPLIWNGAGVQAGQVRTEYVDHYDTFQTLLDLADSADAASRQNPGRSYWALLKGEQRAWSNTLYGEYGDLRMVRDETWKYVHRYPDGPHDLFNLRDDPDEKVNLINEPALPLLIEERRRLLEAFYAHHDSAEKSGLRAKDLPRHNRSREAWRDGLREKQR
jgi:choline-sulfatase